MTSGMTCVYCDNLGLIDIATWARTIMILSEVEMVRKMSPNQRHEGYQSADIVWVGIG